MRCRVRVISRRSVRGRSERCKIPEDAFAGRTMLDPFRLPLPLPRIRLTEGFAPPDHLGEKTFRSTEDEQSLEYLHQSQSLISPSERL